MQPRNRVNGVAQVTACAMQINRGVAAVSRVGRGRNPPALQPWDTGFVGAQSQVAEGNPEAGGRTGYGCAGMVKQLPASLPHQKTQSSPGAEHGDHKRDGESAG